MAKYNLRQKLWRLAACIAVPLVVGGISGIITAGATGGYGELQQPWLAPPGWLFPIMWTILYILMGVASYRIYMAREKGGEQTRSESNSALLLYGVQLFFNFCWSIVFFGLGWYWLAFVWLMVMWLVELLLVGKARKLDRVAMWMLVPLVMWTTFAAYLNLGFAILN